MDVTFRVLLRQKPFPHRHLPRWEDSGIRILQREKISAASWDVTVPKKDTDQFEQWLQA